MQNSLTPDKELNILIMKCISDVLYKIYNFFKNDPVFYRAAWNATRSYDEISVCPSVCLSVRQTCGL